MLDHIHKVQCRLLLEILAGDSRPVPIFLDAVEEAGVPTWTRNDADNWLRQCCQPGNEATRSIICGVLTKCLEDNV